MVFDTNVLSELMRQIPDEGVVQWIDAQIAAISRSRGSALATRNLSDFEECGIRVIDPWKE